LNFPKANRQLVQRLVLPQRIKIRTQLDELAGLDVGQVMYYRPEHQADAAALQALTQEQLNKLILNKTWAEQLSLEQQSQLVAIHLKQPQLFATQRGELRVGQCYLAACHDLQGLQHAQTIGCDAALLSPILATATHPEVQGLGWSQFQQFAQQVDLPIIALGGLKHEDLGIAQQHAAYGIAGISQV
jgi:8-oxo-dGTP diphosphatase